VATRTLLTVRETARLLGVHENTVRNWERKGILRAARLPSGFRRFEPHEVEQLRSEIFAPAVEGESPTRSRKPRGRFVFGDDV
jgi:excisionase family DNA binding protein